MGHIIALVNQKGGVAKTTTAINLSAALNKKKKKVLLVDLDPQGNATSGIGINKNELAHSVYDCLIGDTPVQEVIVPSYRKGLDVLPSHVELAGAEQELTISKTVAPICAISSRPLRRNTTIFSSIVRLPSAC